MIIGPPRKDALAAYLAGVRYAEEVGGINVLVGGAPVPLATSREGAAALQGTYAAIGGNLRADNAVFKFADGVLRPVSNADMQAAVESAYAHRQACFDAEAAVLGQINSGAITTEAQVDAAFASALGTLW